MEPDQFVNAVIAYDNAQRAEYMEFKKTGNIPSPQRQTAFANNNPDVIKTYEQKRQAAALQAEIDSFYNQNSFNNLNRR